MSVTTLPLVVYPLSAASRPRILEHLVRLSPSDRRLRFGVACSDEAIAAYVERLDFERDAVFGVSDAEDLLVGITHLARVDDVAELGLSVSEARRGSGFAQAMFRRALLHARNRGFRELCMHCLSENAAMVHIARKAGMHILIDGTDRDAWLALPPATPVTFGEEIFEGQLVLLDWALRGAFPPARDAQAATTR